ncbi:MULTISPECIES: LytR/AlgR family response regulator transcription factor [Shinella]|jgi:two-component system LytT family response regulator|uniref:LytTR family two component transcriptional regulator n=1 Tax=Shinella granuli TaxID=323621 RepID=A0A4R2CMA5_SHIGR|nr:MULTISPECIES: LytTR family DNA-binding domain-containing protein [Shinella]ANH04375.1 DNA-binding response regulator [Shinella sp. HZN7]TCN42287.1 LytTR family two component transcriptional regulator [Shinella granuli]
MTEISVLIIDDEPIARRRMVRMLAAVEGVSVAGEAGDVPQALEKIAALAPSVLLLDIQMPGGSGFDVLEQAGPHAPLPIFVTAFDHHAIRAFECNAVDYLTKPVTPERLRQALDRARDMIVARENRDTVAELRETVAALRKALREQATRPTQFWVKSRRETIRIPAERVLRFQADGDYVQLHADQGSFLYNESLSALERRLPREDFLRISRSAIVRRDQVARVKRGPLNVLHVVLRDETEIKVGRTYLRAVRDGLMQG